MNDQTESGKEILTFGEVYELYHSQDALIIFRELDGLHEVLWRGLLAVTLLIRVALLALDFSWST